jgi:hypothetical protein
MPRTTITGAERPGKDLLRPIRERRKPIPLIANTEPGSQEGSPDAPHAEPHLDRRALSTLANKLKTYSAKASRKHAGVADHDLRVVMLEAVLVLTRA